MANVCDIEGVHADGPLELWRNDESGRLMVRVITECGYSCVELDLWELFRWTSAEPRRTLEAMHPFTP